MLMSAVIVIDVTLGSLKLVARSAAVFTSTAPAGNAVATTYTGTATANAANTATNDRRNPKTPRMAGEPTADR